jgi:hypothetical protein
MYKIMIASLVTALVSWSALAADAPTRIIVNGVVLTMDKNDRRAEAVAPDDGFHGHFTTNWPRFLPIQRCSAAGGQTSNTIAHFALDFERKESVCGDHGHRA